MEEIRLHTSAGNESRIFIAQDFSAFNHILTDFNHNGRQVVAIIDENVEKLYGSRFPFPKIVIQADEEHKSFDTAQQIVAQLVEMKIDRDALLLGIGGGITTDLCGFVAAIYKRGIDCAFIPTTLLAMIDAAIGGKNGVNVLTFKNMAGTIRQPKFVFVSCDFLQSFSREEMYKGLPEMFKVFLIKGKHFEAAGDFFSTADVNAVNFCEKMQFFITEAIRIKCEYVQDDEFETAGSDAPSRHDRRFLNLGHTFAHAIEHCTPALSHGEAVGIGLVLASQNSNPSFSAAIAGTLRKCGLPCQLPENLPAADLRAAMLHDKKNRDGRIHFVALAGNGECRMQCDKAM